MIIIIMGTIDQRAIAQKEYIVCNIQNPNFYFILT